LNGDNSVDETGEEAFGYDCVLFVSLSASDNVLPTMGSEMPSDVGIDGSSARGGDKKGRQGMAKALVDGARNWVGETGDVLGFWRRDRGSGF